jgi:hypothetical protein
MPTYYSDDLREARALAIVDVLGTDAVIQLYAQDGDDPDPEQDTLLVSLLCNTPLGTYEDGALVFALVTPALATASGNADYAVIATEAESIKIFWPTVTDRNGDGPVILDQEGTAIEESDTITVLSVRLIQGNAPPP